MKKELSAKIHGGGAIRHLQRTRLNVKSIGTKLCLLKCKSTDYIESSKRGFLKPAVFIHMSDLLVSNDHF